MSAILLLIAILAAGQLETSEACKQKMDFCLSLDGSSTVCGGNEPCDNWEYVIQFSTNTTSTLDIGLTKDRVALATYTDDLEVKWDLTKYTAMDPLLSAIGGIQFTGGVFTDVTSAYLLVSKIFNLASGDNPFRKNVILVISDGIPSITQELAVSTSLAIQGYGITIFMVCITDTAGCTESWAKGMASKPLKADLKTYFLVESYSLLHTVFDTVLEQICYFLDDSSDSKPIINLNANITVG